MSHIGYRILYPMDHFELRTYPVVGEVGEDGVFTFTTPEGRPLTSKHYGVHLTLQGAIRDARYLYDGLGSPLLPYKHELERAQRTKRELEEFIATLTSPDSPTDDQHLEVPE